MFPIQEQRDAIVREKELQNIGFIDHLNDFTGSI